MQHEQQRSLHFQNHLPPAPALAEQWVEEYGVYLFYYEIYVFSLLLLIVSIKETCNVLSRLVLLQQVV